MSSGIIIEAVDRLYEGLLPALGFGVNGGPLGVRITIIACKRPGMYLQIQRWFILKKDKGLLVTLIHHVGIFCV